MLDAVVFGVTLSRLSLCRDKVFILEELLVPQYFKKVSDNKI